MARVLMLRFPNPGSTIENFIGVYSAAFERLNGKVVDLDDVVAAVVEANLATSSGYIGSDAIARSTRDDRSRDPLYNQLKMYAELFRTLGWLHSTPESALRFTFTLLGEQLVAAGRDYLPLFEECVLGIAYPTRTLAIMGDFELRPFAFLLRTMRDCGGYLSRDEMIYGPLSAPTDLGSGQAEAAKRVKLARASANAGQQQLDKVANARKIQVNTLHNYTRWPIAVLRDTGWAEPKKARLQDGSTQSVWALTDKGASQATRIEGALDVRLGSLSVLDKSQTAALIALSHYRMMERAGFDVTPLAERISGAEDLLEQWLKDNGTTSDEILFSPFQVLSPTEVDRVFPRASATKSQVTAVKGTVGSGRDSRAHLFVQPRFVKAPVSSASSSLEGNLSQLLAKEENVEAAASAFVSAHRLDTKTEFYPLVAQLFAVMGFASDYSRAGVNYQRWDGCVWIDEYALPIEMKSPTEEEYLSTKAVRQALENKVILLARGGLKTKKEQSSLVVGYKLPNERGDMSNLIDNVHSTFGLRLGVIGLDALTRLALRRIRDGVVVDGSQLAELKGFLDV